jgi:hypothetical protein
VLVMAKGIPFDIPHLLLEFRRQGMDMLAELEKLNVVGVIDLFDHACYSADWTGVKACGVTYTETDRPAMLGPTDRPACIKLGVVYRLLFGEDLIGAHGALADAQATLRIAQHAIFQSAQPFALTEVLSRARAFLTRHELKAHRVVATAKRSQQRICKDNCWCRLHGPTALPAAAMPRWAPGWRRAAEWC